jgi:transposase
LVTKIIAAMGDSNENFGSGILKGLKKVLFHHDDVNAETLAQAPDINTKTEKPAVEMSFKEEKTTDTEGFKDMKLRVYQLLENMNKPGVDFFEVWNAAVEMGGANSNNIKSAFTSLKYADKSLDKSRLLESGTAYVKGLKTVIETESLKRLEEKNSLDKEMAQVKSSLESEISSIEHQITSLQEKLAAKKSARENIHENYEPRIADIETKINAGQQSVNSVLAEMQQVIDIIKKDLN